MTKRIFIWVAHPKPNSLNAALAARYAEGARAKGAEVREMALAEMQFSEAFQGYDPNRDQTAPGLAPDLKTWQDNMTWADHVLIVHPYWWGAMPARAKAVLDMALLPGFAFKYHARGVKWDKLLVGRTGDAIITSDTPPWLDTLLYLRPARRVIRNQVMKFCGIAPRAIVQMGSVKLANEGKVDTWLARAQRMGAAAAG
jgi:putative NADPH-quinone reductase